MRFRLTIRPNSLYDSRSTVITTIVTREPPAQWYIMFYTALVLRPFTTLFVLVNPIDDVCILFSTTLSETRRLRTSDVTEKTSGAPGKARPPDRRHDR